LGQEGKGGVIDNPITIFLLQNTFSWKQRSSSRKKKKSVFLAWQFACLATTCNPGNSDRVIYRIWIHSMIRLNYNDCAEEKRKLSLSDTKTRPLLLHTVCLTLTPIKVFFPLFEVCCSLRSHLSSSVMLSLPLSISLLLCTVT
jgi:hypothetical protein